MTRKSTVAGLAALILASAGSAMAGDPAPSWTFKATYVVHIAFGKCGYSGSCSGGGVGYTCPSGNYCCPASITLDPPSSVLWRATVEAHCAPGDEEFPNLGAFYTPGVGPDPAAHTVFGTAPSRLP